MAASAQKLEGEIQDAHALSVRSRKRRTGGSWGLPTGQDVLNLAKQKYLQKTEASNGFVRYLKYERKVVIVDVQPGSLIITVECSSSQILEELWKDYLTGYVNKMAHTFLATKEVLDELGLTEVKFTTTIPRKEYETGRKKFLDKSSKCHYFYKYVVSVPLIKTFFLHWLANSCRGAFYSTNNSSFNFQKFPVSSGERNFRK